MSFTKFNLQIKNNNNTANIDTVEQMYAVHTCHLSCLMQNYCKTQSPISSIVILLLFTFTLNIKNTPIAVLCHHSVLEEHTFSCHNKCSLNTSNTSPWEPVHLTTIMILPRMNLNTKMHSNLWIPSLPKCFSNLHPLQQSIPHHFSTPFVEKPQC